MLDGIDMFPDQSHIDRVRDALWSRYGSGSSVLVGSGFSRCALKAGAAVGELPTLREVACKMTDKLYPLGDRGGSKGGNTGTAATNNLLSLAQEYETSFGRSDLHGFLQQLVRDEDFKPGDAHEKLLRLPWRDVFTTNWDTLLERARSQVVDRAYNVVRDMDEIPLSNRPRIVKLHGSLPAQFPLIFTEEDYRTYPTRFAPFVNTVQQAMMETVFCLIGFSGNDPNFLHWSGWVRDNLGALAPKIYLAGWLDLPPHRRRMLEDRGVVPIDLARHPRAHKWPEHLRHKYATEWVLSTLERGQPYDVTDWPSPLNQPDPVPPDYLDPIVEVTSEQPKDEPVAKTEVDHRDLDEVVSRTLDIWAHNRKLYPGWLVFPAGEERESLRRRTDDWERHILRSLSDLMPVERLNAVRELVWRREILLEPISSNLESAAEDVLGSIDCQGRTINGVADTRIDWSTVREVWRTIALALVTAARFRFDADLFTKRTEALEPFLSDDLDLHYQLRQERCLWAIYSMDFETLESLLEHWTVKDCDPIWMIRKAALLWELERNDEAADLVKHALDAIRSMPVADVSVAGPSREGWALWSAITMDNRQEFRKRWDELAALKCDSMLEIDLVARQIGRSRESQEVPTFDLATRRRRVQTLSFSSVKPELAVYRAIRLSEVAGLPLATKHPEALVRFVVASDILKSAAEELARSQSELAIRLVLRACASETDKTLMRVLSRTRIALVQDDSVRRLAEDCKKVIDYGLPRRWVERIRVALEVLSRLVLRLGTESVLDAFDYALEFYRNRQHQLASHFWISIPLQDLLNRAWEALPQDQRERRAIDLLGAPIVGLDGFTAQVPEGYSDPGELVNRDSETLLLDRNDETETQWRDIVNLLIRALRADGGPRRRAVTRLVPMVGKDLLTEAETSEVADALWAAEHTPADSLPGSTSCLDWVFLILPEPEPRLAAQRFRRKWLAGRAVKSRLNVTGSGDTVTVSIGDSPNDPIQLEDSLWNVGVAIAGLRAHGRSFELTDAEHSHVVGLVSQWATASITSSPDIPIQIYMSGSARLAIQGLVPILSGIDVPEPDGERLYEKLKKLTELGIPGFELMHALVKAIPDSFDELLTWLRMGLASDDENLVTSATSGLRSWLAASVDEGASLRHPPDDLLREIGFMIASRRSAGLAEALQLAKWVFDEGTQSQRAIIGQLALQGLGYLAEELRYDRDHDQEGNVDVPLLRLFCTQLAKSMAQRGHEGDPVVARWLELGRVDPLPEVRYTVASSACLAT